MVSCWSVLITNPDLAKTDANKLSCIFLLFPLSLGQTAELRLSDAFEH